MNTTVDKTKQFCLVSLCSQCQLDKTRQFYLVRVGDVNKPFSAYTGKRRTAVVNLTIALFAEPFDKTYVVSSNMTFVICHKYELQISTGSVATNSGCDVIYYMGFVCNLLLFLMVKEFRKSVK